MHQVSSSSPNLQPMSPSVCATEARFCLPHPVTLKVREKFFSFSGDDFKISCATTGTPYFQCEGRTFSLREKKILRDAYGVPVANLKEKFFTLFNSDTFHIFSEDKSDRKLLTCFTTFGFIKSKLTAKFTDASTGTEKCVVLKASWREKQGAIYLGEPKQGGIPIAKIYRPFTFLGPDTYYLEIAPGVDIALMVLMCIALDEHKRD